MQENISQVQGDLGAVSSRVDGLGQDVGALRGDIGLLHSAMTSQMGSMGKNMGTQVKRDLLYACRGAEVRPQSVGYMY
jgi:hypothetical protein